jgi:hypothetical protein
MASVTASVTSASDKQEVLYKCSLCCFWHLWGVLIQPIREQTSNSLRKIIAQFMNQQEYHTPNPGPNDRPI